MARSSLGEFPDGAESPLDERRFFAPWVWTLLTRSFSIVVTYFMLAMFSFHMLSSLPDSFEVRAMNPSANASILAAQKLRGLDKPGWTRMYNWVFGMPVSREALYNKLPVFLEQKPFHEVNLVSVLNAKPTTEIDAERWLSLFIEEAPDQGRALKEEASFFIGSKKRRLAFVRQRAWRRSPVVFSHIEDTLRAESFSKLGLFPLANIFLHEKKISLVDDDSSGFLLVQHDLLGPSVVSFSKKDPSSPSENLLQYRVTTEEVPLARQLGCQEVAFTAPPPHTHQKTTHLFIPKEERFLDKKGILHVAAEGKASKKAFLVWLSCDGSRPQVVVVENRTPGAPPREVGLWHAITGQDATGLGFSKSGELVADLLFGASSECGNDVVEGAETCDDGNLLDGDSCSARCTLTSVEANRFDAVFPLRRWLLSSSRIASTLWLMVPALLLALLGSLLLAASDAYAPRRKWAALVENVTGFLSAMPSLVWALFFIFFFAVQLRWFPAQGIRSMSSSSSTLSLLFDRLYHLVLPCLCLAQLAMARWFRILRPAWRDAMQAPHCTAARARGASEWRVVWRHAGRSVFLVLFTLLALALPQWLGGALLIEILFALPGTGRLLYDAILAGDFHTAMVIVLLLAMLASFSNVAIEVLLQRLDPRVTTS